MYAIGGNAEAARLSGIRDRRSGSVGFVIVALAARGRRHPDQLAAGSATRRTPASTSPARPTPAAFLGAACFRPGEFNIPGRSSASSSSATIATGLTMLNLQTYLINLVQGAILDRRGAAEPVGRRASDRRDEPLAAPTASEAASAAAPGRSSSWGLVKHYPGVIALDHADARSSPALRPRPAGQERRRQEHPDQDPRRRRPAGRGRDLHRRRARAPSRAPTTRRARPGLRAPGAGGRART